MTAHESLHAPGELPYAGFSRARSQCRSTLQPRVRERARFDLAMESIRTFHASVSEDLVLREPQFHGLRARLLSGAREFSLKLESLLEGNTDDRSRLALGRAYDELAGLTDKIGSKSEALELYRHELTLWRELARGQGTGAQAVGPAQVAHCLVAMGRLQYQTGHPCRHGREPTPTSQRC